MTETLSAQAQGFLWAGGAGAVLGALYDLGRALRRTWPGCTLAADWGFSLLYLLALLALSLYTGGLRLYQVLALGLGAAGYFLTLSPPLLRGETRIFRGIRSVFSRFRRGAKKSVDFLRKNEKKLFPSTRKWGTIHMKLFSPHGKGTPKRGAIPGDETESLKASHRRRRCRGGLAAGRSGRRAR